MSQGGADRPARAGPGVRSPAPRIDIPHFVLSPKQKTRRLARGGGRWRSVLAPDAGEGDGDGRRGRHPRAGTSWRSTSRSRSSAEILGEELALPRIQPKGKDQVESEQERYYRDLARQAPSRCATSSAPTARR